MHSDHIYLPFPPLLPFQLLITPVFFHVHNFFFKNNPQSPVSASWYGHRWRAYAEHDQLTRDHTLEES